MLIVGGIGALQSATVIMGLPFSFVMILVMVSLYRSLRVEARRLDSGEQAMPVAGRTARSGEVRWQHRLGRMLTFPNAGRAREFEDKILLPTFGEIVDELAGREITATCDKHLDEEGEQCIELTIDPASEHPFHYQVFRKEAPMPLFGGRPTQVVDKFVRMEVYLDVAASQGYDIMGYTKEQLLNNVLDQYERHLEFLQMQEFASNAQETS